MKKLFFLFVAIVLMAGLTNKIMAQTPNSARAEVLTAIGLTAVNPLEFGGFTPGALGTVVISPLGNRTATGGVVLNTTSILPTAASYNMTGAPNVHYTIQVPITDIIIVHVGNSASMIVNTFTCSYPLLASTLSPAGTDAFTVGGTLHVDAAQAAGLYVGTFNVTVAY